MLIGEINAPSLMSSMTLHVRVTGARSLTVRVRLATWLIRLATRVLGTKCVITLEE